VSFFKPKKEATATVMTWLLQHGLKFKVACHDDCIIVEGNAGSVERMLGVQLHQFVHSQTQSSVIRSLTHYNIPATVAPHVTVLSGLLRFPRLEKSPHVKRLGEPGVSVTPQSIRKYYNITVPATSPKNLQAVVSFLGQYFDPADLAYFQKSLDLPQKPISKIIGPNDASNPGTEASLDVDYLTGIPGSIETWVRF
jgi:subtilase family serine protease